MFQFQTFIKSDQTKVCEQDRSRRATVAIFDPPAIPLESIHHSPGPGRHSSALSHFPAQARTAHTARPRTWISGPAITARDPDPARTARSGTQTSGPAHSAHELHTPRLAPPHAHLSRPGQMHTTARPATRSPRTLIAWPSGGPGFQGHRAGQPEGATHACSPLPRKRRHDAAPPTWAPAQLELILNQVSPSQHGPRPPWARTRTADVSHARSRFHKHANALFKHTYAKWARESTRE